jgi:hypothetical protein
MGEMLQIFSSWHAYKHDGGCRASDTGQPAYKPCDYVGRWSGPGGPQTVSYRSSMERAIVLLGSDTHQFEVDLPS